MRFRGLVNVAGQDATASSLFASVARLVGLVAMVAGLAALVGSASGCSLIFSEAAPAGHETRPYFNCGESMAPPILDTVAVGVFGISALGSQSDTSSRSQMDRDTARAVAIGGAVLTAASAVYGYVAVSDCRAARQARAVELARASWLPPPYGLPPYGAPPSHWPPDVQLHLQAPPGPVR